MMRGGDRITEKQRRFADLYIKYLNGTKAYMEAYETDDYKNASKNAVRVRKSPEVKEYIEKGLKEAAKNARVDAERMVSLLADIAFTSPADMAQITQEGGKQKILWKDFEELPEEVKRAIGVIKNTPSGIVVETLDRMKAIDLLMKYVGVGESGDVSISFEGEGKLEE